MFGYLRHHVAQTAGHSWDGGLQVYNNPIPRVWLGLLVLAAVLALAYWLLFPSWPLPGGHYQGLLEIELKRGGERVVTPWSTAAELEAASATRLARQQRLESEILRSDYYALLAGERMREEILAMARVSFLDRCSACHGVDGRGIQGLGADLVEGPWRADAGFKDIEQQLQQYNQRHHAGEADASVIDGAASPSRGLSSAQIKALTLYVQQLAAQ